MTKNELARQINSANASKGFWNEPINYSEKLVLVVTELSEAIEAHRLGKIASKNLTISFQTPDDEFKALYEREVKGTVDEELADAAIRILDFMGGTGLHTYENYILPTWLKSNRGNFNFPDYVGDIMAFVLEPRSYSWSKREIFNSRQLDTALAMIESLACKMNTDLYFHIVLKVKYNSFREYLHGKKY